MRKSVSILCGLACAVAAMPMQAAEENLALEEIIVTAQKRAESLQDTPIALTAFGEDALEREGIANVGDLANNIPALTIEPFPINNTTLRIYIRGIGLIDAQVTQDPPVGVYMDGAYIARSSGLATDIADLERIEVLRGPQGTLYGRNSTGGAVNLVTKRPSPDAMEFAQTFTGGNQDLLISKTSLNLPLADNMAAKFAYYRKSKGGYIENTGIGPDFSDNETEGLRFDFAWDPADWWRIDYAYDQSEVEHYNMTYHAIIPSTPLDTGDALGDAVNNAIRDGTHQFYDYPGKDGRPDSIAVPIPLLGSDTDISGHALTMNFEVIEEVLDIKYIYAQRDLFDGASIDLGTGASTDGYRLDNNAIFSFGISETPGGDQAFLTSYTRDTQYGDRRPDMDQEQSSHELQLSGSMFDGQFSYIGGLYFFEESGVEDNLPIHHQLTGPVDVGAILTTVAAAAPLPIPIPLPGVQGRIEVLTQQHITIENEAKAAFSQLTWKPNFLDQKLSVTLGARMSKDSRSATLFRRNITMLILNSVDATQRADSDIGTLFQDGVLDVAGSRDFEDESFSYIISYQLSDDINIYFKENEAYKSGGFNIREPIGGSFGGAASVARFENGFDAEKVRAKELGIKAQLWDNRLRINADIFQTDFTNQQLNFSVPGSLTDTTVANAGSSTLDGFELDTTLLAAPGLVLVFNYAYLEAEIGESINPLTNTADDGFVFNSAPKHAYTVAADWAITQGDWGSLRANATYSYTDERNGGGRAEFVHLDRVPEQTIINARIGAYDMPVFGGNMTVAAWGKNLGDEEYIINAIHNLPQADRAVLYGPARSFGLDLIWRYSD